MKRKILYVFLGYFGSGAGTSDKGLHRVYCIAFVGVLSLKERELECKPCGDADSVHSSIALQVSNSYRHCATYTQSG